MNDKPKDVEAFMHDVIEMAWADDVPFEAIQAATGLSEAQVKRVMKIHLKPSSYRLWRERIYGRKSKHARKTRLEKDEPAFDETLRRPGER